MNRRNIARNHPDHLGSASFITDFEGGVEQHLQYMPFGEQFVSQSLNGYDARYKFTGKERDEETGLDYFGARYYDSDMSLWLSVDPMSDGRPNLSPYNYCQWNPIGRIDPDGAFDDNYSVDLQGNIKLEEKTKDKFDVLYTKESWDNGKKDKSITVDKGILNNPRHSEVTYDDEWNGVGKVTIKRDYYYMINDKKSSNLFEFLAQNTKVEWNLSRIGNTSGYKGVNLLLTVHENGWVASSEVTDWLSKKGWSIRGEDHNHPGDELFPLGNPNPSGKTGDIGHASHIHFTDPKAVLRIYTAGDRKYHSYTDK